VPRLSNAPRVSTSVPTIGISPEQPNPAPQDLAVFVQWGYAESILYVAHSPLVVGVGLREAEISSFSPFAMCSTFNSSGFVMASCRPSFTVVDNAQPTH
jgi:hypothetical protein